MEQPSPKFGSVLRALFGVAAGTIPLLVSMAMPATHRSPYLWAYPVVILSAWVWGLPASISAAVVSGLLIEYFMFATHRVNLSPNVSHWVYRECLFVGGSVLVGVVTQSAAKQRQRSATADLRHRLELAQAEARVATERARATKLALENEVRTKLALDGANVGLWEWDIQTNESKWSDGFYRLHGRQPGSSANYAAWRSCVHPDDIERVEAALDKAVAEGGTFYEEYRVPTGFSEGVRWVACQGTITEMRDGKATKMSGYAGEVTRRKLADLALIQSEKLAVAGRLSATIAHEIRNPLDAAVNIVYLVREGVDEHERQELLSEAALQLERISQIARQTLDFSRSYSNVTVCRPSALVEQSMKLLSAKLRVGQVEVSTETRGDPEFACVPTEMQQILTNLLNNAAEAIYGPGRIRIRISESVDWAERNVRGIRITIGDTGPGMPKEVRERIAEPFFTTKGSSGTGLGMWVVSELLAKHNGRLSIFSSMGPEHHGTVVSLFVPFRDSSNVEESRGIQGDRAAGAAVRSGQRMA